jgi:NAD(P)-dependent dehydrogenase (short-subunit alcohol dehydrogenase family)
MLVQVAPYLINTIRNPTETFKPQSAIDLLLFCSIWYSFTMVKYKDIKASNTLINEATAPRIAVFVGGTSGIGKSTVEALVATGTILKIYLVGRKSSQQRTETFIHELHAINPSAEIVWVEGEVSLLAETKRVCEIIKSKERHVDLLFLTTGYAPFTSRRETSEGLEISQSLSYYSRMLFVSHLLPLLNEAEAPRVVSVLGGGLERATIETDDIDLKKPANFNIMKAQLQYVATNTLFLETLADENPEVTFVHSWPGWVNTGNVRRGLDPGSILAWIIWFFLEPLIAIFSYSNEESGQRHLFQSTSAAFGGHGTQWVKKAGVNSHGKQENGLFLVNYKCECTPNSKVMALLRESAQKKVVDHTKQVLEPYLVGF